MNALELIMTLERRIMRLEKALHIVPPPEDLTHPKALAQFEAGEKSVKARAV